MNQFQDLKLGLFGVILFTLWIFQAIIGWYLSIAVALILLGGVGFVLSGGAYRIAIMRLDYLERKAQVEQIGKQAHILKAGETLVIASDTNQMVFTAPAAAQEPAQLSAPTVLKSLPAPQEQGSGIKLLDLAELAKSASHFATQGETGDGKSTLIKGLLTHIRKPFPNAELIVIDPKNAQNWPVKPQVSHIEGVLPALQQVHDRLQQRVDRIDTSLTPVITIIDEHDWIVEEYKTDYISLLRKIFKVGREFNYHLMVSGQSPLSKDNKLSRSDWRNFGRIVLGREAVNFCNAGDVFKDLRPQLQANLQSLMEMGKRGAIVFAPRSVPYVAEVPEIRPDLNFEIRPSILSGVVRPDCATNLDFTQPIGRTDGRLRAIVKAHRKGMEITRDNFRLVLKQHGYTMTNSDYQTLKQQLLQEIEQL